MGERRFTLRTPEGVLVVSTVWESVFIDLDEIETGRKMAPTSYTLDNREITKERAAELVEMVRSLPEPPPFDPDKALDDILTFLTGHRTLQGYARFADTVRELHNHIRSGGRLPRLWNEAMHG